MVKKYFSLLMKFSLSPFFVPLKIFLDFFFFYAQPAKEVGGFTGYAEGNSRRGDSPM